MPEVNHAGGSERTASPCAEAWADLIEPTPLMSVAAGIQNPVLIRPSPSLLILRYSRRSAISAWLLTGYLLIFSPIVALASLAGGSWFCRLMALPLGGFALFFWYLTLRHLILNKPVALVRFDRGSQCLSTRNWFGLHRRRRPLSEVGAVQLVSAVGKT